MNYPASGADEYIVHVILYNFSSIFLSLLRKNYVHIRQFKLLRRHKGGIRSTMARLYYRVGQKLSSYRKFASCPFQVVDYIFRATTMQSKKFDLTMHCLR